jgi:hypothetical protein
MDERDAWVKKRLEKERKGGDEKMARLRALRMERSGAGGQTNDRARYRVATAERRHMRESATGHRVFRLTPVEDKLTASA